MKKLSKVVLAASMFAALFAGCSNGGLVANDVLDAPDLEGYVTENGVAVVYWQPVSDVEAYTTYVKAPGTEEWAQIRYFYAQNCNLGARQVVTYNVDKLDSEYEFKVVASSDKANVLASEETITLETPEAWVDTAAIAASSIELKLVANTKNSYNLYFPRPAGYTYQYKVVLASVAADADAKDIWTATNATSTTFTSDSWNANYTTNGYGIKEYDDDDNEVSTWVDGFVIPNDNADYRVIVKMIPDNAEVATKKYVLSSATVKFDASAEAAAPESNSLNVEDTSATKKTLTFKANKRNGVILSTEYRIYQKLITYTSDTNGVDTGSTSEITLLGTAAKDASYSTTASTDVQYKFEATVKENTSTAYYDYTFFVVYTDADGDSVWTQF